MNSTDGEIIPTTEQVKALADKLRLERNLNHAAIAKMIGVSANTFSQIVNGKIRMKELRWKMMQNIVRINMLEKSQDKFFPDHFDFEQKKSMSQSLELQFTQVFLNQAECLKRLDRLEKKINKLCGLFTQLA